MQGGRLPVSRFRRENSIPRAPFAFVYCGERGGRPPPRRKSFGKRRVICVRSKGNGGGCSVRYGKTQDKRSARTWGARSPGTRVRFAASEPARLKPGGGCGVSRSPSGAEQRTAAPVSTSGAVNPEKGSSPRRAPPFSQPRRQPETSQPLRRTPPGPSVRSPRDPPPVP